MRRLVRMHAPTHGQTTRKHNASGTIYWADVRPMTHVRFYRASARLNKTIAATVKLLATTLLRKQTRLLHHFFPFHDPPSQI